MSLPEFLNEEQMFRSLRVPKEHISYLGLRTRMRILQDNYDSISRMIAETGTDKRKMDQFEVARKAVLLTLLVIELALEENSRDTIH